MSEIAGARESVFGYVMDIKAKFKDTDPEYVNARALYRGALGKYTKWAEYTSDAIVKGRVKNLRKDSDYANIAKSASDASQLFIQNVQGVTGVTKSVTILASLVDAGLKIWNGWKDRQAADRKDLASRFDSRTKWQQWEDVGKPPTLEKTTDQASQPTPNGGNNAQGSTDSGKTPKPKKSQ